VITTTPKANSGEDTDMSKSKPKAPPPPTAPDYKSLCKEYSSWTARSQQTYDKSSASTRAKLAAAGADPTMIEAALADLKGTYEGDIKKYQTSQTYKLLKEGYDIARGAKANIYSGKAKGVLFAPGSETETSTTERVRQGNAKNGFGLVNKTTKGVTGLQNTLEQFYAGGYESGEVEVDKKAENLKRAKLNAGGTGGSAALTGYEKQKEAGTNPWVV